MPALRQEIDLPRRLLGVGLPLTILAGTGAALLLFDEMGLWPAAVLATVLAPTDAALGQAVVTDPSLPSRIRQGLNVESGLNDGLCVPLLAIFLTLAESEEGLARGEGLRVIVEEIGGGHRRWRAWRGCSGRSCCGRRPGAGGSSRRGTRSRWWRSRPGPTASPSSSTAAASSPPSSPAWCSGGWRAGTSLPTDLADELGELLGALTFLVFGAVALGPVLGDLTWAVVAYALLSLTVVRMLPVAVSLVGTNPRPVTVGFVGWFGPRGLASIVFALDLVGESGLAEIPLIVTVVGLTVALSVLLHGLSAAPGRRALRPVVHEPPPTDRPHGGPTGHRGPAPRAPAAALSRVGLR